MAYQPAFEPAQVGYLDFETRSPTLDLRQVGAYRYATEAEAIVLSYAIGPDAEPAVYDFKSGPLTWARAPDAVKRHHDRVMAGEAIWAAWNAGFDRAVWNYSTLDFPEMRPAHIIDVMAQATAAGLPPDLAQASRLAHGAVKLTSGRDLIKLFCLPGCGGDPWRHQQEWQNFLNYACADVAALRDLFRRTLQLPAREWEEYFAMDHINERGARVDLAMVRQAAALAREDRARSAEELYKITLGAVASVDEVANMVQWLLRVLPADIVSDTLIKRPEEVDDDGNVTRPAKHHLTRKQVRQLIVDVTAALAGGEGGSAPALRDALRLLEIRLYGGSKTPQKFLRIEQQVIDDVLFGQYVFGGAGQTGRASSRGAQVHNLARDTLPYEHQAIEALLAGADYSTMAALGDGAPVSRKLSLLIRPAFVPALGNLFVWSDWSQIEARILPWLAGDETRLNVFREVDADPSKPDLYTRAAAALSGIDISEVTPPIRQRGKVAELSCIAGCQPVLTDVGLVPIEDVTRQMRVWDGVGFVAHDGVVFRGVKDVWEYQGLVATADHVVWTTAGPFRFDQAAKGRYDLTQTGAGGTPIRLGEDNFARAAIHKTEPSSTLRAGSLHRLQARMLDQLNKFTARPLARLSSLFTAPVGRAEMVGSTTYSSEITLHQFQRSKLEKLRCARYQVQVQERDRGWSLGNEASRFEPRRGNRPDRQQQALRSWKYTIFDTFAQYAQYAAQQIAVRLGVPTRAVAVSSVHDRTQITRGIFSRRNSRTGSVGCRGEAQGLAHYRGKARVYDIVNAGPRHRFTVSGVLVHNCGFGGGANALCAMAANYGLSLSVDDAAAVVARWRENNQWCVAFWDEVYGAVIAAMRNPGMERPAGRVTYCYLPRYFGGSLICTLPSGRALTYRQIKYENVPDLDDEDRVVGYSTHLRCARGYGRIKLWRGMFVENIVQATAADFLRGTLVRLVKAGYDVRLHTHDEILIEASERDALWIRNELRKFMCGGFPWSHGLPLASEETVAAYYTKDKSAYETVQGLEALSAAHCDASVLPG
jgi:DNA polymerase bacteriophage-type